MAVLVRNEAETEIEFCDSPGDAGGVSRSGPAVAYLLSEGSDSGRSLGAGVLWADKLGADRLVLISDHDNAGELARRAGYFDRHSISVVEVVGTGWKAAVAAPITPVPELPAEVWALAGLINETGARAVDDHGRLVAEVAGLEVARVTMFDDGPQIEVGVGQADRELHQLVHSNLEPDAALRRAVGMVASHRHTGAIFHPLKNMARERWLRSRLLDQPGLVGAEHLDPVPPLHPRSTVLGQRPIAAVGTTAQGTPIVVVCSIGVDPEFVPDAADYRARFDAAADLVLVVPTRDRYPITERLVAELERASLVTVPPPWDSA